MTLDIEQIVTSWHRAVNSGNSDALPGILAENVVLGGPRGEAHGIAEAIAWVHRSGISLKTAALYPVTSADMVVKELAIWPGSNAAIPVFTRYRAEHNRIVSIHRFDTLQAALDERRHAMPTTPAYGFVVNLDMPIAEARPIVEAALKDEGFGVLTEIDVKATLKKKIDVDFEPYVILGACSPKHAHKVLTIDPNIGLFLPCNVTLHEIDGQTRVSLIDPMQMLAMAGDDEELLDVAREVETAFHRVEAALSGNTE